MDNGKNKKTTQEHEYVRVVLEHFSMRSVHGWLLIAAMK